MISNEHGLNFIEIPYSGGNLFSESLLDTNRDLKKDNNLLDKAIEYYNLAIIKNPYQRAVDIYKNGMQLRKENNLKSLKFATYFENTLNKWGDLVEIDNFTSQYNYIKDFEDIDTFKYEDLIKSWHSINEYIENIGLNTIRFYTDPDVIKNWETEYKERESIEIVNYVFEDDFKNLDYTKL
tara:strand:- start:15514 stop:16056 length:543 start_codon:yes stop_codon:yes gene_type:complete